MMKITKRQLRRIIKEEKARLLVETEADDYMDAKVAAVNYLDRDQRTGVEAALAADMLNDLLDDWDNDPNMSGRMEYYNRIVGVTKLLEGP
jgi:hypothetical protein